MSVVPPGTGRLLLDFLADGIDAVGVDNSPEMLSRCRAKAAARGVALRVYGPSSG